MSAAIEACPHCGDSLVYQRLHMEPRYRCGGCGDVFEDPISREYRPAGRDPIPADKILDDIKRVADEFGRVPSVTDYTKHGTYSVGLAQTRFGSWDKAVARFLKAGRGGLP